jgi:hypothetical protein
VDKGTYKSRRVSFEPYAVRLFTPYLYFDARHAGCGATALSVLTGVPPLRVRDANRCRDHYSDKFMLAFLRRRAFRVRKLTMCDASHAANQVGLNHVLLMSQLFSKNECTWVVTYRGVCWHNCDTYMLDKLSLINKPAISIYFVWHPRWGRSGEIDPIEPQDKKSRWFSLVKNGVVLQRSFSASLEDAAKRFRLLWGKLPEGAKILRK